MRIFKSLPEYTLSSTRGTTQKIVGFSSPTSSINNLTSYSHWVNDGHIPNPKFNFCVGGDQTNPKFNYYIKCSFRNDRYTYTTYTYPTPETNWSTMPYEYLLNGPKKSMCEWKVRYVYILFLIGSSKLWVWSCGSIKNWIRNGKHKIFKAKDIINSLRSWLKLTSEN